MKLRSGKVVRRLRSSPKIWTEVNNVVEETSGMMCPAFSPQQSRRRSPRNKPCVPSSGPSSSTHSMSLRPRK